MTDDAELEKFKQYKTVARWIEFTTDSSLRPRQDWAKRLDYLKRFCDSQNVDPDTMVQTSIDDNNVKNDYLRAMKKWLDEQGLSPRERHEAENMLRHFFMKQGFRMMTKPFADVYKRSAG